MKTEEKQQLISELKDASEDVLGLGDLEKVEGGGIVDVRCTNNNVPMCGCTTVPTQPEQLKSM